MIVLHVRFLFEQTRPSVVSRPTRICLTLFGGNDSYDYARRLAFGGEVAEYVVAAALKKRTNGPHDARFANCTVMHNQTACAVLRNRTAYTVVVHNPLGRPRASLVRVPCYVLAKSATVSRGGGGSVVAEVADSAFSLSKSEFYLR